MSTKKLLIVGSGWTGTHLLDECKRQNVTNVSYTTTSGKDGSIAFKFDPASEDPEPFRALPDCDGTLLVTFPILGEAPARKFLKFYALVGFIAIETSIMWLLDGLILYWFPFVG
ncbi:hypothetical protein HDU97_000447 [Phlyctochytrium planicorne]|nr:hypothetical protein HDU97_000447 [Phlyctochytrium planicorne]